MKSSPPTSASRMQYQEERRKKAAADLAAKRKLEFTEKNFPSISKDLTAVRSPAPTIGMFVEKAKEWTTHQDEVSKQHSSKCMTDALRRSDDDTLRKTSRMFATRHFEEIQEEDASTLQQSRFVDEWTVIDRSKIRREKTCEETDEMQREFVAEEKESWKEYEENGAW